MKIPQLSVVIVGRNEGQRLIDCIHSVKAMNEPPEDMEIVYVDTDSSDGSPARAKELGAVVIELHPKNPTIAMGRNAGWRAAKAPLVLFIDGDTILHPDFVKEAKLALDSDPKVAIVWGNRRELYPEVSIYQRALDLDWIHPPGQTNFSGGDILTHRSLLEKVGGYNERLIAGEEGEMCQRLLALNYVILHIDKPMTMHDLDLTHWSQYWRRSVRTGHGYAELPRFLRNTAAPLWKKESRHNLFKASMLTGIFLLGFIMALFLQSFIPIGISLLVFLLLSLRSAVKARWKSSDPWTLFLYGLHSQFQHIPIAFGQLSFYYLLWRGKSRRMIDFEYDQ